MRVQPYTEATVNAIEDPDDIRELLQYFWILWKHKGTLVAATVFGILIATGISLWMTPQYRAQTSIEILKSTQPFDNPGLNAGDPTLETHAQLVQSLSLRQRTLAKVNQNMDSRPPKAGGMLASIRGVLGLAKPEESITWSDALQNAAGTLVVVTPKSSNIIVIQSESPNPVAAAAFTNTLAREYIATNQEQRWEHYENTGQFLTQAQQELRIKAEESEQRLAAFARSKGFVFTSGTEISEDKLNQLQSQLLAAANDRIVKQSTYESSLSSPTEALPAVLDSGPMAQYQLRLAELRQQRAELQTTLTPSNYRLQRVEEQIKEVEAQREAERKNILSRIRIDYEAAEKRENDLRQEFDRQASLLTNQSEDMIRYNMLLREVETNKKLYETTLQHGKEATISSAMRTSSGRIVDVAPIPGRPSKPNLPLNLAAGTLGGFLLGAGFVILRFHSNPSIQSMGVLEEHLQLRELGVIPAAKTDPGLRGLPALRGNGDRPKRAKNGSELNDCLELVTWNRKPSLLAEAFRATMTSILFSGENGDRPRVLVLSSPSPQEGKSSVVSNLAIALAQINQRVLLIDADMRLPRLHTIFNLPNTFGLSDVLSEQKPINEYVNESLVHPTEIPNLFVLPAGPARTNLSRLLYSQRMEALLARVRETFDTVLIDTAPVLSVPDSRIVARGADAVILVVRAHKTHQEAAVAAARCFIEDGRKILGTILNDWNPKMSDQNPYRNYTPYNSRYLHIDYPS
jgi:capsular exopolysaccharide synthesis family protein